LSYQLPDAIYDKLKADAEFMTLLSLSSSSTVEEVKARIVRGVEADSPITKETAPLVLISTKPGRFGNNHLVYEGKFCLDIFAKNSN
jgi:hypothetical protein